MTLVYRSLSFANFMYKKLLTLVYISMLKNANTLNFDGALYKQNNKNLLNLLHS